MNVAFFKADVQLTTGCYFSLRHAFGKLMIMKNCSIPFIPKNIHSSTLDLIP